MSVKTVSQAIGNYASLNSNSAACTCAVFCSVTDVGIAMAQVDMKNLEKIKTGRFLKAFDKGVCSHFPVVSFFSHT